MSHCNLPDIKKGPGTDPPVFSTKGQVVIPKDVRDAKGFVPGARAEMVDVPEGVLIRAVRRPMTKRPITELFGILKNSYNGPPITVEDMNEAVAEAAVERY
jgi:bifunctional DNA-binding transcriptional regulator/antitoxin component of YhaV-PrlF toxin-antitoxin module